MSLAKDVKFVQTCKNINNEINAWRKREILNWDFFMGFRSNEFLLWPHGKITPLT